MARRIVSAGAPFQINRTSWHSSRCNTTDIELMPTLKQQFFVGRLNVSVVELNGNHDNLLLGEPKVASRD